MSKEMNNILSKVTKYDMISGLFLSLIIGIVFSFALSSIYLLGVVLSMGSFLINAYATERWLLSNGLKLTIISIVRILLVVIAIIPFVNSTQLVVAYLVGFSSHYAVLIYCGITTKGSA